MRRIFRRIKTEPKRGEEGRETEIARNVVPLLSIGGGAGGEGKSLFNLMSRIIADSAVSLRALVAPISFPAVKKYCGLRYESGF